MLDYGWYGDLLDNYVNENCLLLFLLVTLCEVLLRLLLGTRNVPSPQP